MLTSLKIHFQAVFKGFSAKQARLGCLAHIFEGHSHLLDQNVTGDAEGQA